MLFATGVTLLFSSFALAQYGGPPPAQTTTTAPAAAAVPSAPANTTGHVNINVAPGSFTYSPNNFNATNGTQVTFWFPAINQGIMHSVTQGSFANPCTYLAATSNSSAGFDSGLTNSDQFTITITDDTKPIWFHCKFPLHCGLGMVGAINAPTSGNTFDSFMAAAVKIGSSEVTENDNGAVLSGVNANATAAPSATGSGALPAATQPSSALKTGVNVGAALLGAAFVLVLA
ncbi:hypothetical protein B0H16DRAFT_1317749 [Mycena metata]|uniref:Blue (type 1) copper domain-containing protein n=1 Tax=Mycena metata TaxID=1033252 RepID=A0AAD7IXZ3_9AGAR|nr:hypothetical protein B0H16DRAFT_1317749 [Mycena metata]